MSLFDQEANVKIEFDKSLLDGPLKEQENTKKDKTLITHLPRNETLQRFFGLNNYRESLPQVVLLEK